MPKIRKVKRKKSYKVNINRKRLRNKLRKLPAIECKDIKEAWEGQKSARHNMGDMGLAYDANEVLKIPNLKREILLKARLEGTEDQPESDEENRVTNVPTKVHIARRLEAEAKAPRERCFRLPNQQVQFVTYLMDKYGDDYESMARDKKNYYQMTWRQIRAKINSFKGVAEQYAEYLVKKGEIVLDEPETLQETRKRIAAANVAKHCAPKAKKARQTSQQLEEIADEFDTADRLEDIEKNSHAASRDSTKKIKLFSDDESEEEDEEKKSKKSTIESKQKNMGWVESKRKLEASKRVEKTVGSKRTKYLEKLPSSDSESEEEFEGSEDEEGTGFVDLKDLSEEELSDNDELDDGEFVTDSDEESD